MSKGFASNYRMVLLATGICLCFGGITVRLVWLHVVERDELLKYVDQARRSFVVENARRGNIRAARGEILATSRTLIDVGGMPHARVVDDDLTWPKVDGAHDPGREVLMEHDAALGEHAHQGAPTAKASRSHHAAMGRV